jgi:hypothetical protein
MLSTSGCWAKVSRPSSAIRASTNGPGLELRWPEAPDLVGSGASGASRERLLGSPQ